MTKTSLELTNQSFVERHFKRLFTLRIKLFLVYTILDSRHIYQMNIPHTIV